MTGKKTKLLIAWLICALLLLGACGRQAAQPAETAAPSAAPELTAEPAPEPTPKPASEATPEPAPEPVLTAELLHVCNGEDNEFCLAASADGTRFLIAQRNPTDYTLWVQNADGSDKRDLVLAGMTEEDAKGILGLHVVRPQKGVSIEEAMNERLESLKKQYGSYVNALTHTFWQQLSARYITTAGDYILLTDHAAWGSARINMRTGETALLPVMAAKMDRNGTVLCFDTNSSGTDRYTGLLRPDQSVPEEADYILPAVIRNVSLSCRLMTDGTLWMIDRQYMDAVELDGRSFIPAEVSVVHYDSSGKELRRISGGVFADSVLPDCLLYSVGSQQQLLWGEPMNGGVEGLPRLALAFYIFVAAGLALISGVVWLFLRNRDISWIPRLVFFAPVSYLIAHFLIKGTGTQTFFMERDFISILLISVALYVLFSLVWQIWLERKKAV